MSSYSGNTMGTTQFLNQKLKEEAPIFSKQKVKHPLNHPLTQMVSSNGQIVLALGNKTLQRVNQNKQTDNIETIDLTKNLAQYKIAQMFLDPTGGHLVLTLKPTDPDGLPDLMYLSKKNQKPKMSSKIKGHLVTAVGWNMSNQSETTTGPVLMGTTRGLIFETELTSDDRIFSSGLENYWKQVFDIGKGQHVPINGIEYYQVPQTKKYFIIATTPTRMYQFQGYANGADEPRPLLRRVFNNYLNIPERFLELPSSLKYSVLSIFYQPSTPGKAGSKLPLYPKSFGWMTEHGIYAGQIDPYSGDSDTVTVDCQLIPFPSLGGGDKIETPKACLLTEFHALLLYPNKVKGVCLLNEQVVFEDLVDETNGKLVGIARDPVSGVYYSYCDYAVYRYKVFREERNVWKVYLEKGDFDVAQRYCSGDEDKLDRVLTRRAHSLYDQGLYLESAMTFAKTRCSFEEIALKFMQVNERSALQNLLKKKLETVRTSDKTQMTMILFWLIENYLTTLGNIRRQGDFDPTEYENVKDEFSSLLRTPKIADCISANRNTIYDLLASHGDSSMLIRFAEIMKDFNKMIQIHLQGNEHKPVIDILNTLRNSELFYQYGPILIQAVPSDFVSALISHGKRLDPLKLVPSLVVCTRTDQELEIIRYLEFATKTLRSREPAIHNFLISLYIKHKSPKLLPYLKDHCSSNEEEAPFDVKYALRLCEENRLREECVLLYCSLGQLEEAVEIGLDVNIDLARSCLAYATDREVERKLWLRIAKHVVRDKNDIKQAMEFLSQCELVKIEDILPFFPDFVTIDHFKDAICESLHDYSQHIADLKLEMQEATQSADVIRNDIQQFKNRYMFVRATDTCSICQAYLMVRPFHLFTCGHKFHTDCLIESVLPHLSSVRRRKVEELQMELSLVQGTDDSQSVDSRTAKLSRKDQMRCELDDMIAAECVFCGDIMVKQIDKPFIEDEDWEKSITEWL